MNKQQFVSAIHAGQKGQISNRREILRAFSYGEYWYPLRATVNFSLKDVKGYKQVNTNECLRRLETLQINCVIEDVLFERGIPKRIMHDELFDLSRKMKQTA
jgi:hypothetical protein